MSEIAFYPVFYLWEFIAFAGLLGVAIIVFRVTRRATEELVGPGMRLVVLGLVATALWALLLLLPDGLRPELRTSPFPWLIGAVPITAGTIALIARRRHAKSAGLVSDEA